MEASWYCFFCCSRNRLISLSQSSHSAPPRKQWDGLLNTTRSVPEHWLINREGVTKRGTGIWPIVTSLFSESASRIKETYIRLCTRLKPTWVQSHIWTGWWVTSSAFLIKILDKIEQFFIRQTKISHSWNQKPRMSLWMSSCAVPSCLFLLQMVSSSLSSSSSQLALKLRKSPNPFIRVFSSNLSPFFHINRALFVFTIITASSRAQASYREGRTCGGLGRWDLTADQGGPAKSV